MGCFCIRSRFSRCESIVGGIGLHHRESHPSRRWISIVVLILIVSIVVDLIFGRIHRLFEDGILGWLNSLLGLCLGVASSVIVIALLLHFLHPQISENFANEFENSLFASYLEEFGEEVWAFGEENVKRHLGSE